MTVRHAGARAVFELLSIGGLTRLIRARSSCRGVIFTLHRVRPDPPGPFAPNANLQVTPAFLGYVIETVRRLGFDIVDMDEALRRIESDMSAPPFVVLTFDDAYRDTLRHALPVLRHLECPFTLYVPTALADGLGEIWWQALEDIIARRPAMALEMDGVRRHFDLGSRADKQRAYAEIYWHLRRLPELRRVAFIHEMARLYGYDLAAQCRDLIMDWSELRGFAADRLCTIGAQTVHHYELAKLPVAEARSEIEESIRVLAAQFGSPPRHLSFPLGDRASAGAREFALAAELGLRSAVTTRPGGLYAHHRRALHALPRVSLNGLFQKRRYVDVFATGAVFSRLFGGRQS